MPDSTSISVLLTALMLLLLVVVAAGAPPGVTLPAPVETRTQRQHVTGAFTRSFVVVDINVNFVDQQHSLAIYLHSHTVLYTPTNYSSQASTATQQLKIARDCPLFTVVVLT